MSDHITRNGRKYYEESYLRLANENTKRKAERISELERELAELRARNKKLEWMNREGITDEDIAETMPPKPEDAR